MKRALAGSPPFRADGTAAARRTLVVRGGAAPHQGEKSDATVIVTEGEAMLTIGGRHVRLRHHRSLLADIVTHIARLFHADAWRQRIGQFLLQFAAEHNEIRLPQHADVDHRPHVQPHVGA